MINNEEIEEKARNIIDSIDNNEFELLQLIYVLNEDLIGMIEPETNNEKKDYNTLITISLELKNIIEDNKGVKNE